MIKQNELWRPKAELIATSNLSKYKKWLSQSGCFSSDDYEELWQWSIDEIDHFWKSIWNYFEIVHDGNIGAITSGQTMPDISWFSGTRLNYTEHLFRFYAPKKTALIFCHENGKINHVSWSELKSKVSAFQRKLIDLGIGEGDRVAAILPNIPEAMIAFMAVNALGAIWSCCSPDFGTNTIFDRFSQIKPKLLIGVDGYWYNQKAFDRTNELKSLVKQIGSIKHTIILDYLFKGKKYSEYIAWPQPDDKEDVIFNRVPFEYPIWVLYSSGTTGKPKAITHSHGGILLEHLKYLSLHNDVKPGEHFFWFSTTGWMMWNFLQASLLVGAVPILFDGSPAHPDLLVLWKLASILPIHHFGTSAPYLTALMKSQLNPSETFDLKGLRSIGSTGAPLPPEVFNWVYSGISSDVWLCSMSGGTDVCTAFVGGCVDKPVYAGRIQCRALGCAIQAYDDSGRPVVGELGEMVVEKPMPSMPIYFWNDPNNERYLSSYFEEYPGKWRHGDFIEIFQDGSLVIQGRSDATLNRKGVRIGTAEIYNALDDLSAIKDSLIINIEQNDGSDIMPLFISLNKGFEFNEELQSKIKKTLKERCSPRHVPDQIILVPDIPYTLSGKKMEVPVKRLFLKNKIQKKIDMGAIRNPEAMDFFIRYAEENHYRENNTN